MDLQLTGDQVGQLVLKYNSEKSDLNHYLDSEAVCRALALRVGENPEYPGELVEITFKE